MITADVPCFAADDVFCNYISEAARIVGEAARSAAIASEMAAELYGLTIVNGYMAPGEGGGIYIRNASPTLDHCVLQNCVAEFGGAIHMESPTSAFGPTILNCSIVDCSAALGGALSLDGLITHEVPAAEAPTAYTTAFEDPACLKMILNWEQAA